MPREVALPRARITRRRTPLLKLVADLFAVSRQRRRLAELDPHLLRDLGLTRGEAIDEARRAFWDAPSHWRL
ncbi:DUF1127 domain-containing protein [Salipiger sp. H15]|uniref:DUF1127 domain-containing protein n=1 Tax=Alloyangia sp. H15 TaxID=3029062 RepID=A0AAU8ADT3_9RHOB